jgi:hypothetical protein
LAKRVTERLLAHAKAESGLAKGKFESAWSQLHASWRGDEPATDRGDLTQGFAKLLGEQSGERGGQRRGGPMGASAVVARAFSYATDADGDKNSDGTLSSSEISSVIEGFIKSMPAPRSRRR